MNESLQTLMQEATRLTREGRLNEATAAIQRALTSTAATGTVREDEEHASTVIDGCVFEVAEPVPPGVAARGFEPGPTLDAAGEFLRGSVTLGSLKLAYKLYAPPNHAGRSLPLVVMLHGCTQNPDDFAAGTGMNSRARDEGFFVLYPEQSHGANPQHCWNWFKHTHQARGRGEPAAIVAATQEVMRTHGIDARRVYIAGLSAGGAMAHIVALAYPEVFAAVGVHSGLPSGSASNVSEALAAMKNGSTDASGPLKRSAPAPANGSPVGVPTIVFHGDHDTTVHPRNGEQVLATALRHAHVDATSLPTRIEQGVSRQGRPYSRKVCSDDHGRVIAEHWVVHGAGHAWSGGSVAGSYTDPRGPDATGEMLRFFREHPRG